MPRYFFHVEDGAYIPDDEGAELLGIKAARHEAVKLAGSILRDEAGRFWANATEWRLRVTDEQNLVLFTLTFSADEPEEQVPYDPPS